MFLLVSGQIRKEPEGLTDITNVRCQIEIYNSKQLGWQEKKREVCHTVKNKVDTHQKLQ